MTTHVLAGTAVLQYGWAQCLPLRQIVNGILISIYRWRQVTDFTKTKKHKGTQPQHWSLQSRCRLATANAAAEGEESRRDEGELNASETVTTTTSNMWAVSQGESITRSLFVFFLQKGRPWLVSSNFEGKLSDSRGKYWEPQESRAYAAGLAYCRLIPPHAHTSFNLI